MTIVNAGISEISSQTSLAARREARRKRILENAEDRLRKLTGVEQKSHVLIDDFKPIKYEESSNVNHDNPDHTRLVNEILTNSINQRPPSQSIDNDLSMNGRGVWKYNKLNTTIGLALLANLFTLISPLILDEIESHIGWNMIFLPFLAFKCLEYYLQNNSVCGNNIFHLFVMANLKNDSLKRMFVYTQYLTSFTQDLGIYFFIFVCFNQLFKLSIIFR